MRIYLAGRCDTAWRDEILGLKLAGLGLQAGDLVAGPWPLVTGVIDGTHDYLGAYPVERIDEPADGRERAARDQAFVHNNLAAINQCDVVFAWIDRHGLYGTIAEVAHAHARGKTVWIAFKTADLELAYWFVAPLGASLAGPGHDAHARQGVEHASLTALSAFQRFLHGASS